MLYVAGKTFRVGALIFYYHRTGFRYAAHAGVARLMYVIARRRIPKSFFSVTFIRNGVPQRDEHHPRRGDRAAGDTFDR